MKIKNQKPIWTMEELKAYMLLFIMNLNPNNKIKTQMSEVVLGKMQNEFHLDNDYQSIQKICQAVEDYDFTKNQLQAFLLDIKNLLNWAKGKNRLIANNSFVGLKRVLTIAA